MKGLLARRASLGVRKSIIARALGIGSSLVHAMQSPVDNVHKAHGMGGVGHDTFLDGKASATSLNQCASIGARSRSAEKRRSLRAVIALTILGCGSPQFGFAQIVQAAYQFHLTHGQGVPVCDAFLERLRATNFTKPPYCDIPENDTVPGFARLHRVPLTEDEVIALYPKIFSFAFTQNQYLTPQEDSDADIRAEFTHDELGAWKYAPRISVANNGQQDNIVVWQGSGTYGSGPAKCGQVITVNDPSDGVRTPQIAFILSAHDTSIDERQTHELLENPQKNPQLNYGFQNRWPGMFVPLGYEVGFISYGGMYYVYAFNGAQLNRRKLPAMNSYLQARKIYPNTLSVYLRRDTTLREVCIYRMSMHINGTSN